MTRGLVAAVACLLVFHGSAAAHRLDEYLQATLISLDKDRVQASLRLVPGVAVAASVVASIDEDGDGVLSLDEERAYAERVVRDLTLTLDGQPLRPELVSTDFPPVADMRDGVGEIQIELAADLPPGGSDRTLVVMNHHRRRDAAYLMNCLVPRDPELYIVGQSRDEVQSVYRVEFVEERGVAGRLRSLVTRIADLL